MSQSIVYGCIKDTLYSPTADDIQAHRRINQLVMSTLPSQEDWPLISKEMFSKPVPGSNSGSEQTDVVHFGVSYTGIEYEWEAWIQRFEALLKDMYWVSATVHLETEFKGLHTFTWEPDADFHAPDSGNFSCRCEWTKETAFG